MSKKSDRSSAEERLEAMADAQNVSVDELISRAVLAYLAPHWVPESEVLISTSDEFLNRDNEAREEAAQA